MICTTPSAAFTVSLILTSQLCNHHSTTLTLESVGALYVRRRPRVRIEPQMNGGGQVGHFTWQVRVLHQHTMATILTRNHTMTTHISLDHPHVNYVNGSHTNLSAPEPIRGTQRWHVQERGLRSGTLSPALSVVRRCHWEAGQLILQINTLCMIRPLIHPATCAGNGCSL